MILATHWRFLTWAAALVLLTGAAACRDFHLVTIEYHRHAEQQGDEGDDKQTEQEIIEGMIGGAP